MRVTNCDRCKKVIFPNHEARCRTMDIVGTFPTGFSENESMPIKVEVILTMLPASTEVDFCSKCRSELFTEALKAAFNKWIPGG